MSRRCQLTGTGRLVGFQVSHAHNKTKKAQQPNLQWKRIFVPEEDRFVRVRVTTRTLRSISRKGLLSYLRDEGLSLADVT
jgi:large subunit ribosomal protein L28